MNDDSQAPSLYPYFGYREPAATIEWPERVFGFETTLRWDGEDGQPLHAELRCGNGAIMLGRFPGP